MKIGVASPFQPHQLADHLDATSKARLAAIRGVPAPQVTALVRGWLQHGHQVSVFCLDPSVATIHELRGEQLSIHVLPKRRARYYMPDFYRVERRLIREAIRRERPDVINAQWCYEHALGAVECGIPTAVTCQDTPLRYAWISKHWFPTYHLLVAWRVVRHANRLVCVSPYTRGTHPELLPAPLPRGRCAQRNHAGSFRPRRTALATGRRAASTVHSLQRRRLGQNKEQRPAAEGIFDRPPASSHRPPGAFWPRGGAGTGGRTMGAPPPAPGRCCFQRQHPL